MGFPWRAAARCLEAGSVSAANLDCVALAHKPRVHGARVLRNAISNAPAGWPRFADEAARWRPALALPALLSSRLGFRGRLLYVERLEALARAALADGAPDRCGLVAAAAEAEDADGALGACDGESLSFSRRLEYPHGLGPLWSAFGSYLGVSDPWRQLPALAAGGAPRFTGKVLERLVDLKTDGSLRLDLGYFSFTTALEPTNPRFWALFGRPPRLPGQAEDQWARDVAATLQAFTVEALRRMAEQARELSGREDVLLFGAAALNEPALEAVRGSFRGRLRSGSPPPELAAAVGAAAASWQSGLKRGRPSLPPGVWAAAASSPAPGGPARPGLRRLGFAAAFALAAVVALRRTGPWLSGFSLAAAALLFAGAWSAPETLGELAAAAGLAAVYFLVVLPASLVQRTVGGALQPERWSARGSYWKDAPASAGLPSLLQP